LIRQWFVVTLVALACSPPAVAHEAVEFDLETFPIAGDVLPINGRITLKVSGVMPPLETAPWAALELRAGSERVPLKVVDKFGDTTVLVSTVALRPTTEYELRFADAKLSIPWWRIAWTTAAAADNVAPRWRSAPRVRLLTRPRIERGPPESACLTTSIDGDEPVQILAEVKPLGQAIPVGEGAPFKLLFRLGHREECGPVLTLRTGQRYRVTLTAIDAAGNRAPAPGKPLVIAGPPR